MKLGNDFHLNIPCYCDTFEEEEPADINAKLKEIEKPEEELVESAKGNE